MKLLYTILLFFFITQGTTASAQFFIGKKKSEIKRLKIDLQKPELVFDKSDICIREIYEAPTLNDCNKIVEKLLKDSSYGWIRINENQVVSNFSKQRLIEVLEINGGCRVQIHQTAWTKELYELLLSR
ncbi:MAG: hypothetical protein EB025_03855 [Chitinophagaceae bacterium]|nr:hypothetical protein [Chitinophagaceae bacterium]